MCWSIAQEEATDMLLGWGADPEVKDNDGVTPKSISRFNPRIMASISTLQVSMLGWICTEYNTLPYLPR